ncbi:MAG TPA: serine protease [Luteolibacter sp.]|nr:serine protease [Luteolibacter sp.]
MQRLTQLAILGLGMLFAGGCAQVPAPDPASPGPMARQIVAERASLVLVTKKEHLTSWQGRSFSPETAPKDADGGSAAPISADGYFLTADHVLSRMEGKNVFVFYGRGGKFLVNKARVVWRSSQADLALLHVPAKTPYHYEWTPAEQWLPEGTEVIHGGVSTGYRSGKGKLSTSLSPEGPFTGARKFKIDIPLLPGDSGGPVVNAVGQLVGINSAVEFLVPLETAFFVDSECTRPNTRQIANLIKADRGKRR